MLTYRIIPDQCAATTFEDIMIGRAVYYVVPAAPLAWEIALQGYQLTCELLRWPARIERLLDGCPNGRLALLVVTESGLFHAVAPYDEQRGISTWHLADDPPGEPTPHFVVRAATDEDIDALVALFNSQ